MSYATNENRQLESHNSSSVLCKFTVRMSFRRDFSSHIKINELLFIYSAFFDGLLRVILVQENLLLIYHPRRSVTRSVPQTTVHELVVHSATELKTALSEFTPSQSAARCQPAPAVRDPLCMSDHPHSLSHRLPLCWTLSANHLPASVKHTCCSSSLDVFWQPANSISLRHFRTSSGVRAC